MPRKLSDTQVSELIVDHANGVSISKLAEKYGITRNTVKRYIGDEAVFEQKLTTIKKESVAEWLESHKQDITNLLNQIINLLPGKLQDSSTRDLVGAYKILTETSYNISENKDNSADKAIELKLEIVDLSGDNENE